MDEETQKKIDALKIELEATRKYGRKYRSILAKIAGLSGDREKKAIAGAKGGRGNKKKASA